MAQFISESVGWSPRRGRGRRGCASGVEMEPTADLCTIWISGYVDREKTTEVFRTVRDLVASGVRNVVIDLHDSWNGAGLLAEFAHTRAVLADRGGTLRLAGVVLPEFLPALRSAPLEELFLIYDAVREQVLPRPPRRATHQGPPER